MVLASVVDEDGWSVGLGRAVEQILIEERKKNIVTELQVGVAVPAQRAERVAFVVDLAVTPGTHYENVLVVGGVLRLDGFIAVDGAPHILLVPEALQPPD